MTDTSSGGLGQLKFTKGSVSSFSFRVRIPTKSNVLLDPRTIRSTGSIGTQTAQGDFTTEIVNDIVPSINAIKLEPDQGKITRDDNMFAIGGNFSSSGTGTQVHSGRAGACYISITGPSGFSSAGYSSTCKRTASITRSGTYNVEITPYDSTNLAGALISDNITLAVAPRIDSQISNIDMVWHNTSSGYNAIQPGITAVFKTDLAQSYGVCTATYRNQAGAVISTSSVSASTSEGGSTVTCEITGGLPSSIINNDGMYSVSINATESVRGYTLETKEHVFFVCNDINSSGTGWNCSLADFDQDGYTEGIMQPFNYSNGIIFYKLPCDSCPGINNTGRDTDGDGYDNACDPICGDGVVEGYEECDDGNLASGDGCSDVCLLEAPPTPPTPPAAPTPGAGAGIGPRLSVCAEEWNCSTWEPCLPNGTQYRECIDMNLCEELYNQRIVLHINRSFKPDTVRDCTYITTCYDGMLNRWKDVQNRC
jgi:cysteine-rich repeat protein